jgi:hypothetical protein
MNELELIDFEKKGNVIRLYLGKNGNQYGDDWNDIPYEHNAGVVHDRFVNAYADIVIPFDYKTVEPFDDYINSPYSKDDMVNRKIYAFGIAKDVDPSDIDKIDFVHFGDKFSDVVNHSYIWVINRVCV